jgi:hypothetical protein
MTRKLVLLRGFALLLVMLGRRCEDRWAIEISDFGDYSK